MRVQSSWTCCTLAIYQLCPGREQHRKIDGIDLPASQGFAPPLLAYSHQAESVVCFTSNNFRILNTKLKHEILVDVLIAVQVCTTSREDRELKLSM